jgi:hypothetical protein
MTLEQGKPLTESCGEVVYAASFLEWFGEAKRVAAIPFQGIKSTNNRGDQAANRCGGMHHSVEFSVGHDYP